MTPLVEKALKAITKGADLSSGLSYSSDMNRAKEMFLRLHKAGETLSGKEITEWAVSNGWKARDADVLGTLGEDIAKGKKVFVSDGPWWNENVLELLVQQSF